MKIIINSSSMVPIYEQIVDQVKAQIMSGKDLKISALTVKKAYDNLEQDGFTVTVHGKGTYVTAANPERMREEQMRSVEAELDRTVQKARRCGLADAEIRKIFEIIMED